MGTNVGFLKINLSAVQNNWWQVQQKVGKSVDAAAVVKANAYGLGVCKVANALFLKGCRTFFVANLNEAVELYEYLVPDRAASEIKIFVLGGMASSTEFSEFVDRQLFPVLFSPQQIDAWQAACAQHRCAAPSVIKVDTGMHRLGLTGSETENLLAQPEKLRAVNPVLLMSHLACADDALHPLNGEQLAAFKKWQTAFGKYVPDLSVSLANSSGVFLGDAYHGAMVRPGICLYGGNPTPLADNPMQDVAELHLPILQIKTVRGPATVGYGATFAISDGEEKVLAVVAGGYADGIFRYLGNRGQGFIHGTAVPMVGRISMDSVIFDITQVAARLSSAPKQIELLGAHQNIDALAQSADTIGYEVLTQLGQRYHREYYQ